MEYFIPVQLQMLIIDPWTIWSSKLTIQMSSGLQFASSWCAEKALNLLYNCKFWILSRCLRSSVSTSFIIFNLELLSRKSCLISLTIIICHKFASSCQNSCQNLPHMRLDTCLHEKKLGKTHINVSNEVFNTLGTKSPKKLD